jgi:uncharacterized surface protein with fasciclin (FAS1) repeats
MRVVIVSQGVEMMFRKLFSLAPFYYQRPSPRFRFRFYKSLIVPLSIGAILLASCASKPTPAASTQAPAATAAPTTPITSTPVASNPTYQIKPDDQTQARLRIGNCIFRGPDVNIYINGQLVDNGGVPFQLIGSDFSGYIYLTPGTVKLEVAPYGAGLDKGLFAPLDVSLAAGHRYTVAILGQNGDTQHNTLLIDDTKTLQDAGATADQYTYTMVNNITGADAIDHVINGKINNSNIPYGGFQAEVLPPLPLNTDVVSLSGALDKILDPGGPTTGASEGSVDSTACYSGKYPGTMNNEFGFIQSAEYTNLGLLDFLKHYTGQNQALNDKTNSFNIFLALVKTAGLTDVLNNSPHLVFVPSDAAFSPGNISKDKLDALLADPKAAEAFLKEHIVDGYYPYGSLSGGGGAADRTLTAMSGTSLKLLGDPITINGKDLGADFQLLTANGNRFYVTSQLLVTPK